MEGDATDDVTARAAALRVSTPEALPADVAAGLLQKLQSVPEIYGTEPTQFPIDFKIKFRVILGTEEDQRDLRVLFGEEEEGRSRISQIIAEQIAAVTECMGTNTLGKLKWLYFVSHDNDAYDPMGYFETDGHEKYTQMRGPLPSKKQLFFQLRASNIDVFCFEDFYRHVRKTFPLPSVKIAYPPYNTLPEAVADTELVEAFVRHFEFGAFKPHGSEVSYQPSLFGVGGEDTEDYLRFQSSQASSGAAIGDVLSTQLKVINSFRYRMLESMDITGTTFLLRRSTDSVVMGTLTFTGSNFRFQLDRSLAGMTQEIKAFFEDGGYVGTMFGIRRLISATDMFKKQGKQLHFAWRYIKALGMGIF